MRVRAAGPRISASSGEQGGREPAPSRRSAFHSLSPGKASACGQRGGKAEGLHLFLSHCSPVGKEMTAGVSRSGAASTFLLCHTCPARPCPALGPRSGFRPRFSLPSPRPGHGLSGSVLAPGPPPPNPLSAVLPSVS